MAAPEAGSVQQGLAKDGAGNVYITNSTTIHKYVYSTGVHLGASTPVTTHLGGLDYDAGSLYVPDSGGCNGTTDANQKIYIYSTADNPVKTGEFDVSADFASCVGAVAVYNNLLYVMESESHPLVNDRVVVYDKSGVKQWTVTTSHQCGGGLGSRV